MLWFLFQAEDITLTIGQAFDLAYKKFLESKGKELESQKQSLIMQKRIEILEHENKELKKRLAEVAKIKGQNDVQQYLKDNNVSDTGFTWMLVSNFLFIDCWVMHGRTHLGQYS